MISLPVLLSNLFNGTPGFGPNFSAQGANVKDPGQWPAVSFLGMIF